MTNILTELKKRLHSNYFGLGSTVVWVFSKGAFPLMRGFVLKLLHPRRISFPLFIGTGVRLHNSGYFYPGKNVYIGDYSYINCLSKGGVQLGSNVTIREFAWCQLTSSLANPGEYIRIGDDTYIGPRVVLGAAAPLEIGKNCQIGSGVNFVAENHEFSGGRRIFDQGVTRKGIVVGDDCWIGNNVIILDGVRIGSGVVIGAGSIVTKDIPDNMIAVGNPAKLLRSRNES